MNDKPLIVFEMANNHMGSLDHGLAIIESFGKYAKEYPFNFAFKFQYRHIPTFIHPHYTRRLDIKYVKRFSDTALDRYQFAQLAEKVWALGMFVISTPFDEQSVELAVGLDVDVLKIASCSFMDWPLLEKISKAEKPVIVSTAGAALQDIDKVVSFFQHREKELAIMHCVGEYPTPPNNLQLNQITLLKSRYPDVPVGFSTHEHPDNFDSIFVAFGKGAMLFEKHVGLETPHYKMNDYSVTPDQMKRWLDNACKAFQMLGVENDRHMISDKERADLRQFQRGVYLKRPLEIGQTLRDEDVFFAFPNSERQLLANDWSKYNAFRLQRSLSEQAPVMLDDVDVQESRPELYKIVQDVKDLFLRAGVVYPGGAELEISHHYGLKNFYETGATMITVVNRKYCKKLIGLLAGQRHPEQFHKQKEETFHMLYGDIQLTLDGEIKKVEPGEVITIKPEVRHSFTSVRGAVIEEISTTHILADSYYTDDTITRNKDRKTTLKYWLE
jgi:sialic acid synthase SpsE/mannose-6-phosphate isomerase-like protein (cupin superfamily)